MESPHKKMEASVCVCVCLYLTIFRGQICTQKWTKPDKISKNLPLGMSSFGKLV